MNDRGDRGDRGAERRGWRGWRTRGGRGELGVRADRGVRGARDARRGDGTGTGHRAATPDAYAAPQEHGEVRERPADRSEFDRRPTANRRVRVTSPQTRIALSRRHRPAQQLLPATDPFPDAAALDRARETFHRQRRLAVRTLCLLGVLLLGTSGLLAVLPDPHKFAVGGLPVAWLLLLGGTYPLLLLVGALHVRSAEDVEHRIEHAGDDGPTAAAGHGDHADGGGRGDPAGDTGVAGSVGVGGAARDAGADGTAGVGAAAGVTDSPSMTGDAAGGTRP